MSDTKRTPGPWRVSDSHGLCVHAGKTLVADLASGSYSQQWSEKRANAHFIVLACNAHDDLLEACKLMKSVLSEMATNADVRWHSLKTASIVDSAIAKAESSSNP